MATCCLPVILSEERAAFAVEGSRVCPAASPQRSPSSIPLSCHCEERSDVATCCLPVIQRKECAAFAVEGSCPADYSLSCEVPRARQRTALRGQPATPSLLHPSLLSLRGAQRRGNLLFACHPEQRMRKRFAVEGPCGLASAASPQRSPSSIPLSCHCEERSDVATCCC